MGLHQCRSEKNSQGAPVRALHVPSHVPSHTQTAAKLRGFSQTAQRFTAETDSPLEEAVTSELVSAGESLLIWENTGYLFQFGLIRAIQAAY